MFQCARVDPKIPIEDAINELATYVKKGAFKYIGLSECSAASLRRSNAVHPIAAVEIEISPWSYEPETKAVLAAAAELGVAVLGYSPLGHGFLTGTTTKRSDIPEGNYSAQPAAGSKVKNCCS